jgi:hypothetical protein
MFSHKQKVAFRRSVFAGGKLVDDWSETATVMARKRDQRPLGYVVVQFAHGGSLCVQAANLRAV